MSNQQVHEDHSTVDGIPADMTDLHSDIIQKHVSHLMICLLTSSLLKSLLITYYWPVPVIVNRGLTN